MIRSFLRRFSSLKILPSYFRISAFASPANRRRTAVLALIVLALATFGGYATMASSSTKSSHWQQLVNRSESFTKIFASRSVRTAPAARTVSGPAVVTLAPTAVTLSWNTFGNLGTETTEPSTANDPNISSANLTLGAGVTAAANGNRFGGNNWFDTGDTNPTTLAESIAGNDYIQFIVTPNAGFTFTPTSLVFIWDRSGTGPSNVTLRSSADGFSTDLGSVTAIVGGAFASNTITISGLTNLSTATTFRLYGYGATAAAGTGGFDTTSNTVNVQLNGTTTTTSTPPTIAAGGPLTRQQGSAAINSTIATVSDSSAGTLTVTASTIPTGISVTNIVNSGGTVTADVSAGCDATVGANTVVLTVMNGTTGLSNTANLTVNVTANTPPTLSYGNQTVVAGGSLAVNPATGPMDNGTVSAIAVQSQGTYTGTISVDNSTGEISISDAAPPGMHTITIRATDNCGSPTGVTDATLTLTVSCPSTLTVDTLDDTPDGNPGDGICADIDFQCTLRAAIEESNALPDCTPLTINFSVTGTINLLSELPWVEHPNLTIQGPGANLLDVHRNVATQFTIFVVVGDVVAINDLTISNGAVSGPFAYGGGVYSCCGTLTVNRCDITDNTAEQGGGVVNEGGNVFINDSTIRNNSASSEGGGVYNWGIEGDATMTLTNCTISGNSVTGSGGPGTAGGVAIYADDGGASTVSLINCTITNNTAASSANAGGIFSGVEDGDSEANLTLKNTILAGNGNAQALTANGGLITSQGNNLDGDGTTGFTNGVNGDLVGTVGTPVNPLLAALGNYGGTMPTHALLLGSPAINAGTATGAPAADQRGIARPQLTLFDIGAFESQGFTLAIASGNNQSTVVNSAFSLPLSVTVTANDAGVPVDGGIVTFTPPGSGASATIAGNPATIAGGTATSGIVTANSVTGTYSVSANATGAMAPVNFSLTNTCQTITVNAPVTNTGTVGVAFSQMFTQTGGIGATTFSTASTLPNGITLAADGTLAGTPTQGGAFPLVVVATDSNGCMGSVNYTLTINALPTINAVAVTRTEGSPVSNSTIANVNDAETGAGSLTVTVNSGAMATVNGVTVSNLSNTGGTVTADVVAACGATTANFTLTVTDGGGATNTATLTVTVDANTPPVLTYNNASVLTGGSQTINPATGPSDNGSVSTIAVQNMGTYTGGISVNNMTGAVSISAAAPAGTHTITIRATDDCGDFTDATFTLTIGCVNALTVNSLGEGADFAPGDGVCETASGNGVCTLRAAVEEANALPACSPFTINFSVTGTITLTAGQLVITHPNLTITGPGATMLTVSGNGASRVFQVNSGVTASLSGMTLTGGNGIGAIETATGGAIYNAGTLTVTNCTVINNATGLGGGIRNHGGQLLTVTNSLITGNAAFAQGAGILSDSGPLTITGSTISNNTNVSGGSNTGGGIEAYGTTLITNSTISGNQAITAGDSAGGIWSTTGATTITACTITGNSASGANSAGGVKSAGSGGTVTVRNSIIAGNTGTGGANPDVIGAFVSSGYNLIGDGTGSTGFTGTADQVGTSGTPINPLLGALTTNGGPTPTHLPQSGSPAIDKGIAFGLTTDQRGLARPVDLAITNAASGDGSDIGAVELANTAQTITADGPFIRQQGSPAGAAVQIAMVSDGQSGAGSLTVTATTVPMGITIDSITNTNGTIMATIAAACNATLGSNTVTLTVSDGSLTATANLTVNVTANDAPTLSYANASVAAAGSTNVSPATASDNGMITGYSIVSVVPPMNVAPTVDSSGVVAITNAGPAGNHVITVQATDNCNVTTNAMFTLTVNCPTITVNPPSLPNGTVGTAYNQTITPSGGSSANYTYSSTGTLPPGLTLSPGPATTATLSGNPATSGNYSFTIIATDTNGCTGNQAYSVTINQAPAFTSAATTTFTVNIAGSFAITTSGFPTVTTITQMGALPTGVMFTDNGNGTAVLSGTPQPGTNGTYPLTLTASNGIAPNATQNFTLVVSGLVCPSVLTVNDLGDAADANPGDGLCATSGGVCTLRAAVEEANAIPACTPLTINFSVTGTINLGSVLPDLNHPNLTITGPGATSLDVHRNSATPFRIFAISASRTVTITGLKITNGLAAGTNNGGGVHNSGTLNLSQCVISGNAIETTSVGGSAFGGGIYSAGPLTIDRCEISGNSGRSGAGITHNGLGSGFPLIITNSTISGNTGVQSGGFDIRNTSASLTNCTISGNTAPGRIGGIDQVAQSGNTSSLLLTNCTVTNNTGSAAIETFGFAGVASLTTTLKNTLVAGNVGANFTTTLGTVTSLGNNLDSDGTSGFTNGTNGDIVGTSGSPINALLGPLTNNGGPTNTHLLLPGSPAIDKGGAGVSTDQRGQARPYDFPAIPPASNGGNNSDIGAVEVQCSAITLAGLPGGTAGVAYTQSNLASGGTAPYTLSVTSGALPTGVTISGNGLTGTPTQPGTFNFTLTAADAYGCTGSQSYTVSIVCPAITLSPLALPNATINVAYPQTITASPAVSYTFSVTGGLLPSGLTLNSNGSFSGAPRQSGVFNFRVTATAFGSCSGFTDYTLLVNCPGITINPASLPGGTLGTGYSQTVSASPAGTYFYSVTSGALPNGLTLNGATGAITGTPINPGLFTFTVSAAAGACSGSRTYTVEIVCQGVSIAPASLPAATAGSVYSQPINVSPAGSYTFSLAQGNLPSGLTLHPTTGVISGLPAVVGTVSFIVKVSVPNSCSTTQAYTLTTNCPPAVTLSPASLPSGAMGTAYSQTLSASPAGGNYMYTVTSGSLPAGLTLNSATGGLSGTPVANGSFTFTATATGFGSCTGSKQYTVVIGSGGCPAITLPASLPAGSTGQFYNSSVAASPSGSYSYTFTGNLPSGVTLYGSLGVLLGYPTANGTYNFTVTATGANNCSASQSYSVVIGAGSLAAINDFSGDHKSDFVLWRSGQRQWLIVDSATNAAQTVQWGQTGDRAVSGDFDGDGKADLAGFGKDGHWRIKLSSGATLDKVWGLGSDVPVPGDYDGDGKTDIAVWRGAESGWYIQRSSDGETESVRWGTSLAPYFDVPVPGDYDGDGKTDIAVFRQANGHWYIRRSSDGQTVDKAWGLGTDVPAPGDYDGDGLTDIAVWRGSQGDWYIVRSSDSAVESKFWGAGYEPYFDVPAVGDYDGDGKADAAVWRKSDGRWYVQQSSDGATRAVTQGRTGDQPVTATLRQ